MTINKAYDFIKKVSEDKQLRKLCLDLIQKKDVEGLEKLAAAQGCSCTYQEVVSIFEKDGLFKERLTDEELKKIAAGSSSYEGGRARPVRGSYE